MMGVGRLIPGGRGLSARGLEAFYADDPPAVCGAPLPPELEYHHGKLTCARPPGHEAIPPGVSGAAHYHGDEKERAVWSPAGDAASFNPNKTATPRKRGRNGR